MAKKMVITIDVDTGRVDSVTDEKGADAKSSNNMPEEMKNAKTTDIVSATVIGTHSSPGCRWIFYNGKWYWVCT
jgi:hypothetical protein